MALSLFAIFKCELLHYHAELMRGARQHRRGRSNGRHPSEARTEADYQAWRDLRDWTAQKYAARDSGRPLALR